MYVGQVEICHLDAKQQAVVLAKVPSTADQCREVDVEDNGGLRFLVWDVWDDVLHLPGI